MRMKWNKNQNLPKNWQAENQSSFSSDRNQSFFKLLRLPSNEYVYDNQKFYLGANALLNEYNFLAMCHLSTAV